MTTLFLLIVGSIGMVLAAERYHTTRNAMQKLNQAYPPSTCRSFILDILILLPLVGLLVEVLARHIKSRRVAAFLPTIAGSSFIIAGFITKNPIMTLTGFLLYLPFAPKAITGEDVWECWSVRQMLYATAFGIFLAIANSLYCDYLNFYFLTPFLGHPEAWDGNHFMWNSGIEISGLKPIVDTTIPTYQNFWGFWNLLAILLLGPVYVWVMVKAGTRLHGLLFGYTPKQTGISALFFERKTH